MRTFTKTLYRIQTVLNTIEYNLNDGSVDDTAITTRVRNSGGRTVFHTIAISKDDLHMTFDSDNTFVVMRDGKKYDFIWTDDVSEFMLEVRDYYIPFEMVSQIRRILKQYHLYMSDSFSLHKVI